MTRAFSFRKRIVFGLGAALALTAAESSMAKTETPDYKMIETTDNNIEIRRYEPMIVAEVTVGGDRQEAASAAFRVLANFIFGDNEAQEDVAMTAPVVQERESKGGSEKIAMTAPVVQAATDADEWRVAFIMPSKYDLETLPRPNDDRIRIERMPARRAAAIRFSGRLTDENFSKHEQELSVFLEGRGITAADGPVFAYYNGPFTPFFLRRNEVIYWLD